MARLESEKGTVIYGEYNEEKNNNHPNGNLIFYDIFNTRTIIVPIP